MCMPGGGKNKCSLGTKKKGITPVIGRSETSLYEGGHLNYNLKNG